VRTFPNLVPDRPDAPGAAISRQARDFWRNAWAGKSLMAIGMKDPVLGPSTMRSLHAHIRNCPPPLEIADGGHFLQEWGDTIAHKAVDTL
jgi:pimeloyl-ACP methyl ester carboxylesterase